MAELDKDATHEVLGVVKGVYKQQSSEKAMYDYYIIELEVSSIDKGKNLNKGDTVYIHCHHRNENHDNRPGTVGHNLILKSNGCEVVAKLVFRNGKYYGLYPNWVLIRVEE